MQINYLLARFRANNLDFIPAVWNKPTRLLLLKLIEWDVPCDGAGTARAGTFWETLDEYG